MTNFPKPSCTEFERLVLKSPELLVNWIQSGTLEPEHLTYAAEILGDAESTDLVVPVLLKLTEHKSSLVREGAIYGLAKHIDYFGVIERMTKMKKEDPSSSIRFIVADIMECDPIKGALK